MNICIFLLLVVIVFVLVFPGSAFSEVRGLWVVRNNIVKPDSIRQLVDFADRNNFNTLFVQIRGRGDAYYKSRFAPGPENYPDISDSFDPLAELIDKAHSRGIEVHAWFNMYLTWSSPESPVDPQHPVNRHPEWFMVSRNGLDTGTASIQSFASSTVEGRYLSPGLESVRLYLSRIISEVTMNYDVDGVHLDYVRYPGRDYDFNVVCRNKFKMRFGIDPIDIVNGNSEIDPDLKILQKWADYRVELIDSNVKDIARRIKLLNKNIKLSAAVKPHPDEAYFEYGQNWAGWLNEGVVDFVVTMSYFPENNDFSKILNYSLKKVDRQKVIGGIALYMMDARKASEQITLTRNMGLLGYCLFSYDTIINNSSYKNGL
ncbi:MAG: family 10 glycosylhydrolase [Candidatus Latescibacteria bacterium]|nr:family 10 glycosylhydrolase [Candidatus Latescibacterota bacterium]